jgi:hypothetical protein
MTSAGLALGPIFIIALLFLSYNFLNIVFLNIVSVSSVKISRRLDELVQQNERRLNNNE